MISRAPDKTLNLRNIDAKTLEMLCENVYKPSLNKMIDSAYSNCVFKLCQQTSWRLIAQAQGSHLDVGLV